MNRRRRNQNSKTFIYAMIFIAVFAFMGVGYSVLTQVVHINGTANISSTWKILFTSATEKQMNGATTTKTPSISNGTTLDIGVQLDKPGSQAIYNVTVANQGTLDAVVKDIKTSDTTPEDLTIYVNDFVIGTELKANATKTFQVVVTWDSSKTSTSSSLSKTVKIRIDFEQKTGSNVKPTLEMPTYVVDIPNTTWSTSKKVTINYPEGTDFIYQYSTDGGISWKVAPSKSYVVTFTTSGTLIARVSDGRSSLTTPSIPIEKVDAIKPSVTITGNTDIWSVNKTLTITASDNESQLATSPYSFDGGTTWGTATSKTFTTNQTVNVWVKDIAGNITKQAIVISKIDTVGPSNVTLTKGSVTSSSITVTASATQNNMGIRGYQFSIDGGSYGTEQTSVSKTFTGLLKNSSHTFKVKVIGKNGKVAESSVLTVTTNNLSTPTYSVTPLADTWATSKTVTITYPGTKTSNLVYEYSVNGGTNWTTVSASTVAVKFTANGSVIARIRDTGNSTNNVSASTFTVSKIDTTTPTFTVSGNATDWTASITITITAQDDINGSGLATNPYSFDGGTTWQDVNFKTYTTNQTVNVWVKDTAGNIGKQAIVISKIDTVAPSNVTLTKGSITSSSITVISSATQANMGIRGYQFSIDGGAYSTEQTAATKTFTGLTKNSSHTFKVKAIGKNGKVTESSSLSVTTSNITAPTYSVTPLADTWATSKTVTITYPGTKTSNLVYEYSTNGGTSWTTVNVSPATVKFTANGSIIGRIRDTGNTANTVTASTFTVSKIDTTAPTFTISGNTTDWTTSKTLMITNPTDAGSGLATSPYSFDGGTTWGTATSKTFTTNQTVNVWVKDIAGNITKQAIVISKIDTVAPSNVTLTKGSVTSSSITVTASATQNNMGIRGYQFSIDGGSYGTEQTSVSKTFTGLTKNSSHTFKVKVIGKNGKATESTSISVTTSNITAPTYTISPAADTWATSKTVTITYPGTKTSNLVYEYSLNGGTNWTTVSASTVALKFTANGSVIARIRDTGNTANTVTSSTFTVSKIDTTAPTFTVSGNTVDWSTSKTLTITGPTDAGSGLATSPYSFDGGTTWGTVLSKTFTANQTVNVWVKDALGNIGKQAIVISKIDTVSPTNVTLTSGSVTSSSITVISSATQANMGIRGYQFSIDGGAYGTEQTSVSKTFTGLTKNSSHTFKVKAIAKNGKVTESTSISVTTSNIATPTYTFTNPDAWAASKSVTINYPSPKPSNLIYEYSVDGGSTWTSTTATTTSVTFKKNGTLIARIRDTGNSANTVTASSMTVTKIDVTAPEFIVAGNTTSWSASKTLSIGSIEESESGLATAPYSFDSGSTWSSTASHTFNTNGSVNVWVKDAVGNIGKQTISISKIDDVPPSNVTLSSGSQTATSITVTASATQVNMGIRGYQFSIGNGAWSTEQTSVSKVFTGLNANTSYSIKVRVWGKNGKYTDTGNIYFRTKDVSLAAPIYTVSPATGTWARTKTVTITYPSTKPSGAVYEYSRDGGETWVSVSGTTTTLTYKESGMVVARIQYAGKTILASTLAVTKVGMEFPTGTYNVVNIESITPYSPGTYGYGVSVCFDVNQLPAFVQYRTSEDSGYNTLEYDRDYCYKTSGTAFQHQNFYSVMFEIAYRDGSTVSSRVAYCYGDRVDGGVSVACEVDPSVPTNAPNVTTGGGTPTGTTSTPTWTPTSTTSVPTHSPTPTF